MAIWKLPSGAYYDDVKNQIVSGPTGTSTPTPTPAPAPAQTPAPSQTTSSATDQTYWLQPGETSAQYNARISAYNASRTGSPAPQNNPTPTPAPTDQWSNLAQQDPFVSSLLQDPSKKSQFDALPDNMKALFIQTASSLGKAIEAGKVVNPSIDITPDQVKQFYDQASTELDPYYSEQFSTLRGNLDVSLGRLSEDYTKNIARAEDPFKQALATQAENEAQQGTAFSSERNRREATAVTNENNILGDAFQSTQRSAQDLLRGYEGSVGTDKARAVQLPTLSPYTANTSGFTSDASRSLDPGLLGGISYGTVGAAQQTAKLSRQNQLEQTYRQNRVLDYSSL